MAGQAWNEDLVHCPGQPLGEWVLRELQWETQGRVPQAGDLLQLERGSGGDRGLEGSLQSYPPPLSPRLPATRARDPRLRQPPAHATHHALVSLNPAQRSEERRVGKECRSRW